MKKLSFSAFVVLLVFVFGVLLIIVDIATTKKARNRKHTIEVMYFNGGYGTDLVDEATRQFEELNPDVTIKSWTSQRIGDKIRLRLLAKDPPDIIYPLFGVDVNRLIADGYLYDLSADLKTLNYEGTGKWGDGFYKGITDMYKSGDKIYGVPMYFDAQLFWYNTDIFKKYNLKAPKTWEEFEQVCSVLKKNNIAPIALQGRYIGYLGGILTTMLQHIADPQFFEASKLIAPGTLDHPYQIKAARMIQDFFRKGYFQEGCLGMTHTEAQMEFMRGNAAMIWCGTWLTSEMKNVIPDNMHYSSFRVPSIAGGKGDQTAVMVGSQYYFVCKESRELELSIKFMKFLCSKQIGTFFVKKKEALMATREANKDTPPTLVETVKVLDSAKSFIFPPEGNKYSAFGNIYTSYLTDLVTQPLGTKEFKITPEEFCRILEAKAKEVREDEDKRNTK